MSGGGWQPMPTRPGELISLEDDDEVLVISGAGEGEGVIDLSTLSSDSETDQPVLTPTPRRRRPAPPVAATNDDDDGDDGVEIVSTSRNPSANAPQAPVPSSEQPRPGRKRRRPLSSESNGTTVTGVNKFDPMFDGKRAESTNISMENNEAIEQFKRVLKCSICLDTMRNMTSTICGHVYCRRCIRAAIRLTGKCPLCMRKLRSKHLHGLFF